MKIEPRFEPYLLGTTFDNELAFSTAPVRTSGRELCDRLGYLVNLCRGRRVLHLGCCDHPPLIPAKFKEGTWLHEQLTRASAECLGLDIDSEAVEFVKRETGFDNVWVADLAQAAPESVVRAPVWDLLVAGEIVEHLDNPVDFLSRVNRNLRSHCREILITVPNAFSLQNFGGALRHEEKINSDHRFWFTPYTLAKILTRSGYQPAAFEYVSHGRLVPGGIRSWLRYWILRRYPSLRQTLVMSATWV
jgi:2-polyprenyl-3-methyl-5-hydroxy-6-metoxy-1,4-benzoquinol methylase